MGFHIRLDDDSEQLIGLLKSNPSEVFGGLYASYMIFLLGERDEAELKWLIDNAKALDSLTGRDIAYSVFAKEFNVKLKLYSPTPHRTPKNLGSIDARQFSNCTVNGQSGFARGVSRLVKNGQFGRVVDGDEVTAITYGSDMVARELGLIDKLPCIVIADAIPAETLCVVSLDSSVTASLMPILRKSIGEFMAHDAARLIRSDAKRILEAQRAISDECSRDANVRRKLREEKETVSRIRHALANTESGNTKKHASSFESALVTRERHIQEIVAELDRFPNEHPVRLLKLEAELQEALNDHRNRRDLLFSKVFERQVRRLGMHSKLASAQGTAFSYLGQVAKPDFLLKVWTAIWT